MTESATEDVTQRLEFAAPGPGSWTLDKAHIPRPATRFHCETVPAVFTSAFGRMFERYGIPVRAMRMEPIHGFSYNCLEPITEQEFATRVAAAEEAVATRRWREDLERWDREVKPSSIRRHLELADVDVDALDDEGLVAHLRTCADHVACMTSQHHEFNGATMVPVGDFLAHATDWTGRSVAELLELFTGASPASTGSCPELDAVREALRGDAQAQVILASETDPATALAALRRGASATTVALEQWLRLVGDRITDGFDVDQPRAVERPGILLACVRRCLDERPTPDPAARLEDLRSQVPAEHREAFDDLYREAFDVYRLRDERGVYSDSGAFGLMRRAMLSAGARLVARGALDAGELAVEASVEELVTLLSGASEPRSDELNARRAFRRRWSVADAPAFLGDPPSPPPPSELLPPAMGRMTRAIVTFSAHMAAAGDDDEQVPAGPTLEGLAASPGVHEGVARLVRSVDDLDRVGEGDVIIAITTSESCNLALSLAAAVVTDQGGLLSHAAILAREYGIPAVVGTGHATRLIGDGTTVRVDGSAGVVTW